MMKNMKTQFAEHLCQIGFVSSSNPKDPDANFNSRERSQPVAFLFLFFFIFSPDDSRFLCLLLENQLLIKAVLCAGFYPNLIYVSHSPAPNRLVI